MLADVVDHIGFNARWYHLSFVGLTTMMTTTTTTIRQRGKERGTDEEKWEYVVFGTGEWCCVCVGMMGVGDGCGVLYTEGKRSVGDDGDDYHTLIDDNGRHFVIIYGANSTNLSRSAFSCSPSGLSFLRPMVWVNWTSASKCCWRLYSWVILVEICVSNWTWSMVPFSGSAPQRVKIASACSFKIFSSLMP